MSQAVLLLRRERGAQLVTAAAGFLLAAALASGAREDAYRAGYRAGLRAATLAVGKIADTLAKPDREAPERKPGK